MRFMKEALNTVEQLLFVAVVFLLCGPSIDVACERESLSMNILIEDRSNREKMDWLQNAASYSLL